MINAEIIESVNFLAQKYPLDNVDVWVKRIARREELEFTVYIAQRDKLGSVCNCGSDLQKVLQAAILEAGERGGSDVLLAKAKDILKARVELAKAESEIEPVVLQNLIEQIKAKT
jgi:hypothetical protein